jgi:hypothetical protein
MQRGEPLVAQARTQQAIAGFFQGLSNGLAEWQQNIRRNQPTQCTYGGLNSGGVVGGTVTCY